LPRSRSARSGYDGIFLTRLAGRHRHANYGYYSPDENRPAYLLDGGRHCKLDLQTGKLTDLIHDKRGGVRDPVINHYDTRIIFSWHKDGGPNYHLWECGID
jgi:hypothetical protein